MTEPQKDEHESNEIQVKYGTRGDKSTMPARDPKNMTADNKQKKTKVNTKIKNKRLHAHNKIKYTTVVEEKKVLDT
jgi:hypothetical protein